VELLLQAEMASLLLVDDLWVHWLCRAWGGCDDRSSSEPGLEHDFRDVLFGVFADAVEPASAGP
jgi:hypothetical protein